jgi:hypothetical protein
LPALGFVQEAFHFIMALVRFYIAINKPQRHQSLRGRIGFSANSTASLLKNNLSCSN